jgi:hypothetical protein
MGDWTCEIRAELIGDRRGCIGSLGSIAVILAIRSVAIFGKILAKSRYFTISDIGDPVMNVGWLRRNLSVLLTGFVGLLLTFASLSGADGTGQKYSPDEARNRLGNTQYWYGSVTMLINAAGHRSIPGERLTAKYTVQHEVTLKFRLSPGEGELTMLSINPDLLKNLPDGGKAIAQLDKMRDTRHWNTPLINAKPEDQTQSTLHVKDRMDSTDMEAKEGLGKQESNYHFKTGDDDKRNTLLIHKLTIDFEKGSYSLELDAKSDLLEITEGQSDGKTPEPTEAHVINADLRFMNQPLPKDGTVLSGSQKIPKNDLHPLGSMGYGSASGRITWTLSPKPLEDVELVLKPDGYDNWLPRGGKNEQTEGNTIKINAVLQKRGGGITTAKITHINVGLSEVSTEPGVCLNVPLTKGASSPDLNFTGAHNPGVTINDKGLSFYKDGSFNQLPIVVSCYDWGAWGTVVAQAQLDDGRMLWATLDGDPATEECRLPKRGEDSKIASKWREDMGIAGLADNTDRDTQNGNNHDGDGLTTYEEYRGLIAKGKHTRDYPAGPDGVKPLTPTHKDLIVRNTIKNNSDVAAGFVLFQKASGIHVVELSDGEMPGSRQVNVNAGQITAGPQFGLVVYDEPSKENAGATTKVRTGRFDPKPSSPKGFAKVVVDLAGNMEDYAYLVSLMKAEGHAVPFTLQELNSTTLAHELAHGVGVQHHGDVEYGSGYKQVTEKMKDWTIYDRNGKLITARPFDITGSQANPGNESSGNVDCIMCYNGLYNWCYHIDDKTFYAVPIIPRGKIFCTDAKGTGTNAPRMLPGGKSVPGLFGDAPRGNCLGQMKVKDQ